MSAYKDEEPIGGAYANGGSAADPAKEGLAGGEGVQGKWHQDMGDCTHVGNEHVCNFIGDAVAAAANTVGRYFN